MGTARDIRAARIVDAESSSGMPLTPEEDALCQQLEQQVDSEIARSAAALIRRMASEADGLWDRLNQVYMAGLMTAPMVIIEIVVMGAMYANKRLNAIIIGVSALLLAGVVLLIRQQALVHDSQFLRSMIPHHAGAILLCRQASISDAEIKELCQRIIASQRKEIDQMKAKLAAMSN